VAPAIISFLLAFHSVHHLDCYVVLLIVSTKRSYLVIAELRNRNICHSCLNRIFVHTLLYTNFVRLLRLLGVVQLTLYINGMALNETSWLISLVDKENVRGRL
jgi:hypothetical protein